jgi:hypothetical protein
MHGPEVDIGGAMAWEAIAGLGERMAHAARMFLDALDTGQHDRAAFAFAAERRRDWDYRPRSRPGLPLLAMRDAQRALAWALVDLSLSAQGAAKVRGVLALEAILQQRTANKAYRDPLNYALAVFGTPGDQPWGWRFEGHHVSLTLTLVPGIGLAVTPHFFGANPFSGTVVDGGHGGLARVLEQESALAFAIIGGLQGAERKRATIATDAPPDFLTGPGRERSLKEPVGLALDDMPDEQRNRSIALLETYFGHLEPGLAQAVTARVRAAGLGGLRFGWAGGTTPDRLHYYRFHGPTLLIEYDRTEADHAHSVWHDPSNHFGEDHLRRHRESAH